MADIVKPPLLKVSFNKDKKTLKCEVKDPAFCTAFQPHIVTDLLNSIYQVIDGPDFGKFEYFKDDSQWGFRIVKEKNG